MKEFKKKCTRCGAEYVTTGAASKYCTDCREIVIKEMKRKQYEKDKEFYKNMVQRCICCGRDFKSTRKRAFCISCGKLTEEERRDLMTIKDSVTRADFRTGAENAYYREDGVLVLPCNEKRKRKKKMPKKDLVEGTLEYIVLKLENENRRRKKRGLSPLSYGKYVAMLEDRITE